MAFRTNYRFERAERDRIKKAKKEEKLRRQQARRAAPRAEFFGKSGGKHATGRVRQASRTRRGATDFGTVGVTKLDGKWVAEFGQFDAAHVGEGLVRAALQPMFPTLSGKTACPRRVVLL
jgi:hypothetical protein